MKYGAFFLSMILPQGYSVTTDGRVFNSQAKELKQNTRKGYLYVTVKGRKYSVHRLVALSYIPNPENKPEIDHIDGNPKNNCVDNLRWVTRSENENNPITLSRISKANKGKIRTSEQRAKISKSLMGLRQSEETKLKRADKLRGRERPEHVKKILLEANKKAVVCIEKETGKNYIFESQKEAASHFGLSTATISCYLAGRIKSNKYIWKRK